MTPNEIIISRIYVIRGLKVMFDRDLAALYKIEPKRLKEQVRRNISRFPEDFMFELTPEEFNNWRSQIATSNEDKKGWRHRPFVFSEHGILMLSSVLNSETAVQMNIEIMRTFNKLRQYVLHHDELIDYLKQLELKYDHQFDDIYRILDLLINPPVNDRIPIGYRLIGS